MSTNASDLTPASEQILDEFDSTEISSINSLLDQAPAPAAANAAAGDEATGAAASTAGQEGQEELPSKDDAAEGEEKKVAAPDAEAGDETPEEKAAKQTEQPDEHESAPIRTLRSENRSLSTKLTKLETEVGALAPVLKTVGHAPLASLSTYVTSDKGEQEFAPEFCRTLEELDPMRYDQVGQFVIDESIRHAPRPVLQEIVRQHGDRVAVMLFGEGATFAEVKQAWMGRGQAAKAATPAKVDDDGEAGYEGLDELLDDKEETPEEERVAKPATPPAKAREPQEDEEKRQLREENLRLKEQVEGRTETAQFEADTQIAEQFLTKALEPLAGQIKDAGLAVLPDDKPEEKTRKRSAVERIYTEVISKLKADKRSALIGEYIDSYHKMPPQHRIEQAQALAETIAEEVIAYHADTLYRKRTAQTKQLTDEPPKNVPGNNQGRSIAPYKPRSEEIASASWDDDAALVQETADLIGTR